MSRPVRAIAARGPACLLVCLFAGLISCGDSNTEPPDDPAKTSGAIGSTNENTDSGANRPTQVGDDAPNVLLVSFDTTRADALGCYGNELGASSTIDALAEEGVLFERAFSPVPLTAPSHATMLTGLDPPRHRVRDNGVYSLPQEALTLAEFLGERGYRTFAVVAAVVMMDSYQLDQGFDVYEQGRLSATDPHAAERNATEIVQATLELVEGDGPFFGLVHFYDPHQPFDAPKHFAKYYADDPRNGYFAEIRYADSEFGRLLETMRTSGHLDDTWIIVTSDHGEGRGEHGEITHGHHLHDATQRIPLVFHHPSLSARRVDDHVASLADLFPTIVELLGHEVPAGLDGRSLRPILHGESLDDSGAAYLETLSPLLSFNLAPLYGVRTLEWKYVVSQKERLYSLAEDPGELNDVAAEHPDVAASLRRRLEAMRDHRGPPLEENRRRITGAELEVLGGIGYVTTSAHADLSDPDRPDAYDHIDLKQRIDEALALMRDDLPAATAAFQALADELPDTFLIRQNLGACYGRRAMHARALTEFQAAAALNPESVEMQINIAMAAQNTGQSSLAQEHLRKATEMPKCPPNAYFLLWESHARDRQPAKARAALEALLARDDIPEAAKAEARRRLQ